MTHQHLTKGYLKKKINTEQKTKIPQVNQESKRPYTVKYRYKIQIRYTAHKTETYQYTNNQISGTTTSENANLK